MWKKNKKNKVKKIKTDVQKLQDLKKESLITLVASFIVYITLILSLIFRNNSTPAITAFTSVLLLLNNIIIAFRILTTNWKNKRVEKQKILWGILALLILGSIASFIFSVTSLNMYRDDKTEEKPEEKNNQL